MIYNVDLSFQKNNIPIYIQFIPILIISLELTYQLSTHSIASPQRQCIAYWRRLLYPLPHAFAVFRQPPRVDHPVKSTRPRLYANHDFVAVAFHTHVFSYIRRA